MPTRRCIESGLSGAIGRGQSWGDARRRLASRAGGQGARWRRWLAGGRGRDACRRALPPPTSLVRGRLRRLARTARRRAAGTRTGAGPSIGYGQLGVQNRQRQARHVLLEPRAPSSIGHQVSHRLVAEPGRPGRQDVAGGKRAQLIDELQRREPRCAACRGQERVDERDRSHTPWGRFGDRRQQRSATTVTDEYDRPGRARRASIHRLPDIAPLPVWAHRRLRAARR
jgi:hypothetical protein